MKSLETRYGEMTVSDWIDLAITKRSNGDVGRALNDFLGEAAPKGYRFLWECAEELHRRGTPFEAIDFWDAAVESAPVDRRNDLLVDMADTLWAAGNFGVDDYYSSKSIAALKLANRWEDVAHRLATLHRPTEEILSAVEYALEESGKLNDAVEVGNDEIASFFDLGAFYVDTGSYSDACRIFSKAFGSEKCELDLLPHVARVFLWRCRDLKIDLDGDF